MHYMLHYKPKVAGAIKSIIGEYRLTPIDAHSTRVNYRLEVRVCVYIMRVGRTIYCSYYTIYLHVACRSCIHRLCQIDRSNALQIPGAQVETGFSLPGPVRRKVNGLVVGAALPALKRYAESIAPVPLS